MGVGCAQRLLEADLPLPLVDADGHRVDDGKGADQERHHAAGSDDEGKDEHFMAGLFGLLLGRLDLDAVHLCPDAIGQCLSIHARAGNDGDPAYAGVGIPPVGRQPLRHLVRNERRGVLFRLCVLPDADHAEGIVPDGENVSDLEIIFPGDGPTDHRLCAAARAGHAPGPQRPAHRWLVLQAGDIRAGAGKKQGAELESLHLLDPVRDRGRDAGHPLDAAQTAQGCFRQRAIPLLRPDGHAAAGVFQRRLDDDGLQVLGDTADSGDGKGADGDGQDGEQRACLALQQVTDELRHGDLSG